MPFAPRLAFVDVETTGMSPQDARITEIAVVRVERAEDGWSARSWSTLIDPGTPVPPEIAALTGINDALLRGAPRFPAIADELLRWLDDAVFVAHQARFDYGFVRAEMARAGVSWAARTLCTVRLSRLLEPEARGHGLDAILARWAIAASGRHRAAGDAQALWAWVQALLARHGETALRSAGARLLRHPGLPSHVSAEALEAVPAGPGVYAMLGEHDQPLYVGRSRNLRRRLASHFSAQPERARAVRLAAETHRLQWQRTAGEFGARLLEGQWIRERQPSHNLAQRRREPWLVRLDPDARRPVWLAADTLPPGAEIGCHGPFASRAAARLAVLAAADGAGLCLATLGLERRAPGQPCFRRQLGRCAGACVGATPAAREMALLGATLAPLRIPDWPSAGPIAIVEPDTEGGDHWHVFDRWRHLGSAADPAAARAIAARGHAGALEPDVYRLLRARIEAGGQAESAIIPLESSTDAVPDASATDPHARSRPCPHPSPPASMAASPATA